jgi:hypothetical protein
MSEQNKRGEIPNEFYELQGLKNQREKLEASYREIFPKVDTYLLHDLLLRLKDDPKEAPMYTVEVFTKEGTDTEASRDHILATTGTVPGIYDKGTHYVTHMRLTLETLKKLNDFDYVLEIIGDYTGSDASKGPMHTAGEAHHFKSDPLKQKQLPAQEYKQRLKRSYRSIFYTLIGVVVVVAVGGFIISGGLLPNVNKNTALVPLRVSDLGMVTGHVTGLSGLPALGASVIAHKIQGLPGTDQRLPDYTTNSFISIDGKYIFNLPPGVYRFTAAFPDGTNHIMSNYAVWPGSSHSLDFKY